MKKYIKKPIPVSALQWTGENYEEIKTFCTDVNGVEKCFKSDKTLWIETREGQLKAVVGDYVMCGIEGEFYPCAESIFNKTYDEVDSDTVFEFDKFDDFMTVRVLNNSFLIVPTEIESLNNMGFDIVKLVENIQNLQDLQYELKKGLPSKDE